MRVALLIACLLLPLPAHAQDLVRPKTQVDAIVPVPPTEHGRVYYYGRRYHHLVPGIVTINRPPYVCDLDHRSFAVEDDFVAHLRQAHAVPPAEIPDALLVHGGQIHFAGR